MHTTIVLYTKPYAGGTMTIWMKKRKQIFWNWKKKVLRQSKVPVPKMKEAEIYPVGCPERTDYVSVYKSIAPFVVLISNWLYFSFFIAILCWQSWCSWAVRKHKTCQQHSSGKQKKNPEKTGIELGARSHLATMSRDPKIWRETRFHKTQLFCTLEHTLTRHLWERLAKNHASRCPSPYLISTGSSSHLLIPKR